MSAPHSDDVPRTKLLVSLADLDRVNAGAGATASRPTGPAAGTQYFDTTIGRPIWWDGGKWINASGGTV